MPGGIFFGRLPDPIGAGRGLPFAVYVVDVALDPGRFNASLTFFLFLRGEQPADIGAPVFPAAAVTVVLEAPRRERVKVQEISRIALAALALGVAAVKTAVGDRVCG